MLFLSLSVLSEVNILGWMRSYSTKSRPKIPKVYEFTAKNNVLTVLLGEWSKKGIVQDNRWLLEPRKAWALLKQPLPYKASNVHNDFWHSHWMTVSEPNLELIPKVPSIKLGQYLNQENGTRRICSGKDQAYSPNYQVMRNSRTSHVKWTPRKFIQWNSNGRKLYGSLYDN